MAKPYDAATKYLIDLNPADWLRLAGIGVDAAAKLETLDADLSTVSAAADRLIRWIQSEKPPRLYHLELQAGYDSEMDERVHWYNGLSRYEHKTPVHSIVFLLRPSADGPKIRGAIQESEETHRLEFGYKIVRLWQESAESLLSGGLATLPLAPLTARSEREAAAVIQKMQGRLRNEGPLTRVRELWTATYVLMGLSYTDAAIEHLLRGVREMKESVTFQKIFGEGEEKGRLEGVLAGRIEATRQHLLTLGTKRFGKPRANIQNRIANTESLEQLERWLSRILEVETWAELLA
jgi:predicted transposase YdaD